MYATRNDDLALANTDSDTLRGKLLLAKESNIEVRRAPFEYINPQAWVVIVGITPGSSSAQRPI